MHDQGNNQNIDGQKEIDKQNIQTEMDKCRKKNQASFNNLAHQFRQLKRAKYSCPWNNQLCLPALIFKAFEPFRFFIFHVEIALLNIPHKHNNLK